MLNLLKEKGFSVVGDTDLDNIKWRDKIEVVDSDGFRGIVDKSSITRGCGFKIFNIKNPHTINNIKHYITKNRLECKLLSSYYAGIKDNLEFQCGCGNIYFTSIDKLVGRQKLQCNDCGTKARSFKRAIDTNVVVETFKLKGLEILHIDNLTRSDTKLDCIDTEGYLFSITLDNIKVAIPNKFSSLNPYSLYNINNYIMKESLPITLEEDNYINSESFLKFKCRCGSSFKAKWICVRNQSQLRCKTCSGKQSNGEYLTEEFLKELKLDYECEFRFNECRNKLSLPFDFRILNKSREFLIEVDGSQHFVPKMAFGGQKDFEYRIKNDSIKNSFCHNNNIPLLRIPYTKFNKKEEYKSLIVDFLVL